jgi:hypothetical protein
MWRVIPQKSRTCSKPSISQVNYNSLALRGNWSTVSPSPAHTGEGKQQQIGKGSATDLTTCRRKHSATLQQAPPAAPQGLPQHVQQHLPLCSPTTSKNCASQIPPKIFCLPLFLSIKITSKSIFVAVQEKDADMG